MSNKKERKVYEVTVGGCFKKTDWVVATSEEEAIDNLRNVVHTKYGHDFHNIGTMLRSEDDYIAKTDYFSHPKGRGMIFDTYIDWENDAVAEIHEYEGIDVSEYEEEVA